MLNLHNVETRTLYVPFKVGMQYPNLTEYVEVGGSCFHWEDRAAFDSWYATAGEADRDIIFDQILNSVQLDARKDIRGKIKTLLTGEARKNPSAQQVANAMEAIFTDEEKKTAYLLADAEAKDRMIREEVPNENGPIDAEKLRSLGHDVYNGTPRTQEERRPKW